MTPWLDKVTEGSRRRFAAIIVGIYVVGALLAIFLVDVAAGHSTYCGHDSSYIVGTSLRQKVVFHHQDTFDGEHWHFYLHKYNGSDGWITLHGYWRRCG